MPEKSLKPCKHPTCASLTREGYCCKHKRTENPNRATAAARGYGYQWQKESKHFLKENPWCAICLKNGFRELANEVDHIVPHCGDMGLFWDRSNWQALSHRCHSRKTAKENGGFGNQPARG